MNLRPVEKVAFLAFSTSIVRSFAMPTAYSCPLLFEPWPSAALLLGFSIRKLYISTRSEWSRVPQTCFIREAYDVVAREAFDELAGLLGYLLF